MSMPEFQTTSLTREESINQIIASIAMEELGLSHIINAEGEKLQYVLGTLKGTTGPNPSATIEDVLKVNDSVRGVLQTAAESQSMLRNKLQAALTSAVLAGPTGPSGPTGPHGLGAILPFMSGSPMGISSDTQGKPVNAGIIGITEFDDSEAFSPEGDIDLANTPAIAAEFAFLAPRDVTIADVTARFNLSEPLTLTDATATVTVQIYQEAEPGIFKKIGGVTLDPPLAPAGSPHGPGTLLSATKHDLKIEVKSGARLLLAFDARATGGNPEVIIEGYASASIGIS